jgi:hypothetical protein
VAKIEAALERSKQQSQFDDMGEAWKASEELMKRVRSELGIEEDGPGVSIRPPVTTPVRESRRPDAAQ